MRSKSPKIWLEDIIEAYKISEYVEGVSEEVPILKGMVEQILSDLKQND